MSTNTNYHKK